jgi:hypothetical protein
MLFRAKDSGQDEDPDGSCHRGPSLALYRDCSQPARLAPRVGRFTEHSHFHLGKSGLSECLRTLDNMCKSDQWQATSSVEMITWLGGSDSPGMTPVSISIQNKPVLMAIETDS